MDHQSRSVDARVAFLATRSHGIVTRVEMLAAGLSAEEIRGRLRRGTLIRVYPGVYRAGHRAPSDEARYLAAVKACGKGALLAGPAAAYMYRILKCSPPAPHVATTTERRVPGIVTHRQRAKTPPAATTWRGIPTVTVPHALVDIAATLTADELARAFHDATILHRINPEHVERELARRPTAEGSATLRAAMYGDQAVLLSYLEKAFIKLLAEANLPLPITNKKKNGHYIDCRWPEHRLTVELDSYRYHHTRHAWQQDRARERAAYARGDQFRRYTYDDVTKAPTQMLTELRELILVTVAP